MSHADGAPNFEAIVQGVADKFANGRAQLEAVTMNDHNADWDILYPFSIVRELVTSEMRSYLSH